MRWFVDISPLGANEGPKQKWCIEAAGWQPALKEARALRGEEGPLGGFSIELLDDGARAVDPATRIRYVIREAPATAPLTHTKAGPVTAAAKSEPVAAAKSEPVAAAKSEPVAAAKSEPVAAKSEPVATKSEPVAAKSEPVAAAKSEPVAAAKSEPVAATKSEPATVGEDDVDVPVDTDEPPPDVTARSPELPAFQLLQSREEDPSERSPLAYREHVYVVAPETSDPEIERLLLARFEAVKASLAAAKPGRFVNLAVFDQAFTGKPPKKPRATLSWKDWRGTPEIRYPAAERASLEPPAFAAPTSASQPVPQPSIAPAGPSSEKGSAVNVPPPPATQIAPTEPVPSPLAFTERAPAARAPEPAPASRTPTNPPEAAAPTVVSAKDAAPSGASKSEAPKTDVSPKETPAKDAPAKETPAADAPTVVAPSMDAPTVIAPKVEAAPVVAPKIDVPAEISAQRPSLPVSSAPKTMPAVTPTKREAFIPKVKTAAEAGRRVTGDDLISELFEACGDLQFARGSLEGADFVLNLALEKIPSEVGLVSLFDINRREFVVVRQAGGPRSIVLARLPERAGLGQAAMRKRSAIVVPQTAKEPRATDDRFRTLGVEQKSLMVAPVEQSGRYLGLIELLNPVDGRAFTEGDGHALTYIGEQFAEFVAERGISIDPEQVLERHQKR